MLKNGTLYGTLFGMKNEKGTLFWTLLLGKNRQYLAKFGRKIDYFFLKKAQEKPLILS